MTYYWRKRAKTLFTLGLIVVLLMGFLGTSHMGMTMGPDGKMTMADCPFMSGSGVCNMSPLEHVAMWQNLFANIPQKLDPVSMLLLIALAVIILISPRFLYPPPNKLLTQLRYYSRHKRAPILTLLQELFSDGILNPKPF